MTDRATQEEQRDQETLRNVRAGFLSFLAAALMFALFGSGELVSMAYDLPEASWAEPLVRAAETWHAAMEALGAAGISEAVREAIAGLRGLGWS